MKDYRRAHPQFSLCGLNCVLCVMHLGGYCPGCGGGEGHQPCAIIRCAQAHGEPETCSQCGDYPCARFLEAQQYDSFIVARNRVRDLAQAERLGADAYLTLLEEKAGILSALLAGYNDGRHKSFFALAVNLLPVQDLRAALQALAAPEAELTPKQRASHAEMQLKAAAAARGIVLRLEKKPARKEKHENNSDQRGADGPAKG